MDPERDSSGDRRFRKTPRKGPCRDPGEPLLLLFGKVRLLESANGRSHKACARRSRSLWVDSCHAFSRSYLQKIVERTTAARFSALVLPPIEASFRRTHRSLEFSWERFFSRRAGKNLDSDSDHSL